MKVVKLEERFSCNESFFRALGSLTDCLHLSSVCTVSGVPPSFVCTVRMRVNQWTVKEMPTQGCRIVLGPLVGGWVGGRREERRERVKGGSEGKEGVNVGRREGGREGGWEWREEGRRVGGRKERREGGREGRVRGSGGREREKRRTDKSYLMQTSYNHMWPDSSLEAADWSTHKGEVVPFHWWELLQLKACSILRIHH